MAPQAVGHGGKNFALFVYAVLKDQKKTHGKTRLVRMLREQRPFKFFNVPTGKHEGVCKGSQGTRPFVCSHPKQEKRLTASKWWCSRTTPLRSSAFSTTSALTRSKRRQAKPLLRKCRNRKTSSHSPSPRKTETVKTEQGEVEFEVGGFEDDFNIGPSPAGCRRKFYFWPGEGTRAAGKRVRPRLPRPAKALRPT